MGLRTCRGRRRQLPGPSPASPTAVLSGTPGQAVSSVESCASQAGPQPPDGLPSCQELQKQEPGLGLSWAWGQWAHQEEVQDAPRGL